MNFAWLYKKNQVGKSLNIVKKKEKNNYARIPIKEYLTVKEVSRR